MKENNDGQSRHNIICEEFVASPFVIFYIFIPVLCVCPSVIYLSMLFVDIIVSNLLFAFLHLFFYINYFIKDSINNDI